MTMRKFSHSTYTAIPPRAPLAQVRLMIVRWIFAALGSEQTFRFLIGFPAAEEQIAYGRHIGINANFDAVVGALKPVELIHVVHGSKLVVFVSSTQVEIEIAAHQVAYFDLGFGALGANDFAQYHAVAAQAFVDFGIGLGYLFVDGFVVAVFAGDVAEFFVGATKGDARFAINAAALILEVVFGLLNLGSFFAVKKRLVHGNEF